MIKIIGIFYIVSSVIVLLTAVWLYFKGEVNDDE